jgi:predicted secreted protein
MRKTGISVLAGVIVLLFGSIALAGDYATLNFIGFSKDGRYLAFEEYGVQDGSGFPYSSFYFIDVAKNSFAARSVTIRIDNEQATENQARSRAKLKASLILKKLRIVNGNTGQLTVARMLTDLSLEAPGSGKSQRINFAEIVGSMYRSGNYELVLNPIEVKVKVKGCEYTEQPLYIFELSLKDKDADKTIILQKDNALPASRFCLTEYAIQYVYLYEDKIAVFLNTYDPGFEGPDMRYLVVTGKFK